MKEIPKTAEERRRIESEKRSGREECEVQTLLNKEMSEETFQDILDTNWNDPRVEHSLHKTCLALRAACMNHTLAGSAKDMDKFVKVADALRNRSEWALDKKHTYRRMILTGDMPSWLQPVEVMMRTTPQSGVPKNSIQTALQIYNVTNTMLLVLTAHGRSRETRPPPTPRGHTRSS
jgi:hypothetical protein